MNSIGNVLLWAVGLTMTAAAIWQFYLFAMFRDSRGIFDVNGGGLHLWLAVGAAVAACVFVGLAIFRRINTTEEFHITS